MKTLIFSWLERHTQKLTISQLNLNLLRCILIYGLLCSATKKYTFLMGNSSTRPVENPSHSSLKNHKSYKSYQHEKRAWKLTVELVVKRWLYERLLWKTFVLILMGSLVLYPIRIILLYIVTLNGNFSSLFYFFFYFSFCTAHIELRLI